MRKMSMIKSFLVLSGTWLCFAKTVEYDFDLGWVTRAPDGFERPVMAINGQWPPPTIEADLGDTIVVHTKNSLGNQSTSLHFHGMYQKGSPAYDGGVGTSQCPIYHGDAFTYTFKADPPGTSWYHAHEKGQYPDGLRGMLIVHDPEWEKSLDIDEQISLTMSDWYHTEHTYLINDYLSPDNTDGDIPSPDCFLFNDTRSGPTFDFEREKRYLIRLVSMASLVCGDFHIEDHTLSVVGVDGIHTKPHTTKAIRVCPGQRYDVVVEGKSSSDRKDSFNWIAKMDTTMLRSNFPPDDKLSVIGNVDYRSRGKYRRRRKSKGLKPSWKAKAKDVLDDTELKPLDETPLFGPVNRRITLRTNQSYYDGLGTRIGTGGQPWAEPKVPTLYTALSTGDAAFHPATYGWGVDPHVLRWDEVVEIYMENSQERPHPMHIHGHSFQLAARGIGSWDGDESKLPKIPMMRDTVSIPANGYILLRFVADNPGVWFFHCHIDLHLVGGMASTIIEAPDVLQARHRIPDMGMSICQRTGRWSSGNCAGKDGWISDTDAGELCNTVWNVGSASEDATASGDDNDNNDNEWDDNDSNDSERDDLALGLPNESEASDAVDETSGSGGIGNRVHNPGSKRYSVV